MMMMMMMMLMTMTTSKMRDREYMCIFYAKQEVKLENSTLFPRTIEKLFVDEKKKNTKVLLNLEKVLKRTKKAPGRY